MIGTIQLLIRTHFGADEEALKRAAQKHNVTLTCTARELGYTIWRVSFARTVFAAPDVIEQFYKDLNE